jgi:hypothetical protein
MPHPAVLLTRAGIQGTGYFQEDEGFEKEPGLQTYTIAMVEPTTLLVWHLEYVDHVDEDTLYTSFDQFVKHINFQVLGVTKDKWHPSTQALTRVFHALWIAFCHRHELKKWRQALSNYQNETQCGAAERQRLYHAVKTVLEAAESSIVLRQKLHVLAREEAAFQHPLLQARLEELIANAVHYTSHHKRHGLTKTTSIVDNFLKIVKRKLRQVESFRDPRVPDSSSGRWRMSEILCPFYPGPRTPIRAPLCWLRGRPTTCRGFRS